MYSMKQEAKKRRSPRSNIAFYISLAVCIAAVAGAAWSVYGSVNDYVAPAREITRTPTLDTGEKPEESVPEKAEALSDAKKPSKTESTVDKKTEAQAKPVEAKPVEAKPEPEKDEPKAKAVAAEPSFPETCKPTDGDIIKPFSPQVPVRSETMKDYRTHSGIDISAGEGTTVKSMMKGKVKRIYSDPMLGKIVCIEHEGGYEAFYCGLTDNPTVSEGDTVESGGTIGYIGTVPSEKADEPHLHLELRRSGSLIDPSSVL